MISSATWRRWHRWVGVPAALFLLFASSTGLVLAFTEFFGADEALREATRDLVSTARVSAPASVTDPVARALATIAAQAAGAPIDKVIVQLKGNAPTVTVFTGKPTGGEDRKFVVNASTGALLTVQDYVDKPFINRLHSGEAFGDGGLVGAMFWALALIALTVTGIAVMWRMRRKNVTGWRRYFF
ncbi:MAG: PepSY domain-containing protein [Gemmatimonadaceae bacterium]|nr:PepSY domain-containing protein [Gemmatimonadaceae bacterium]